jgi:hypothetical protein
LLIDHARALDAYDYYHDPFPPSITNPPPRGLTVGKLQISDAALRFADGDKAEGLERACSAAETWRRLATHSDSLIMQMIGVANFHGAADLFADMLAEMPADAPLPDSCTRAFVPIAAADLGICDTMKTEFRFNQSMSDMIGDPRYKQVVAPDASSVTYFFGSLLFNKRATDALRAINTASYCTSDPDIQQESTRLRTAPLWDVTGVQGTLFNPIGSILVARGMPAYAEYPVRMHDLDAMNRLVGAALALRLSTAKSAANSADASGASSEPVALPTGVTLDPRDHLLHARRAYKRSDQGEDFTIPVPASRLQ